MEHIVGQRVIFFACPYGDVDERVKRAVNRVGYCCAFATHTGPLDFRTDLFEIRRVLVEKRADNLYLYTKFLGICKAHMWGKWFVKRMMGERNRFQNELPNTVLHKQLAATD